MSLKHHSVCVQGGSIVGSIETSSSDRSCNSSSSSVPLSSSGCTGMRVVGGGNGSCDGFGLLSSRRNKDANSSSVTRQLQHRLGKDRKLFKLFHQIGRETRLSSGVDGVFNLTVAVNLIAYTQNSLSTPLAIKSFLVIILSA